MKWNPLSEQIDIQFVDLEGFYIFYMKNANICLIFLSNSLLTKSLICVIIKPWILTKSNQVTKTIQIYNSKEMV
jgi:hypothetical protein